MLLQEYASLKHFNTFKLDAQARYYVHIKDIQTLRSPLVSGQLRNSPWLILGGGSNLLFVQDFEGLVVHMAIEEVTLVKEDQDHAWVKAGAGIDWHALVLYCVAQGYAGIENLSLIPGTVGAAPVQNIGAYGVELSDVFESLEAMEVKTGAIHTFSKADCAFGYRDSIFKNALKGAYIILYVTLRLHKQPTFQLAYGDIQAALEAINVQVLSLKAMSDAVIHIRQRKLPDPAILGNAGSFFKNPVIPRSQFEQLKHMHPALPGYVQAGSQVKIPAAWLIEQCGWKGKTRGAVGVHEKHALVLVNYGGGTGQEIYGLAQAIQQSIKEQWGVALVPEVNIII